MSAPTAAGQIRNLAALAGADVGQLPPPGLDRDLLRVSLIIQGQQRGATWAQISAALFGYCDPRAAKRAVKALARNTQRAVLLRDAATAEEGVRDDLPAMQRCAAS
jgi:hypothetical protein